VQYKVVAQDTWHSFSPIGALWQQTWRQVLLASNVKPRRLTASPGVILWLATLSLMVLWLLDWQLLVAIATGLVGGYGLKHWPQLIPALSSRLQQWLATAVQTTWGQGLGIMVGTYGVLALGTSSGSLWLPVIMVAQIGGILLLRGVSWPKADSRQSYGGNDHASADTIDPLLERLSHRDPVVRLVTVRQLLRQLNTLPADTCYIPGTSMTVQSHVMDCLHLMLTQETEPLVRTAIRDGVRQLYPLPRLQPGTPAVQIQRQSVSVHRHAVEYVEP